jgi:hypothetical protein
MFSVKNFPINLSYPMITNIEEAEDDDDYCDTLLSKELVGREKMYLMKNKQLSTQVCKVLKQAEFVVKEGRELLTRPLTTINPAAENDMGYVSHLNIALGRNILEKLKVQILLIECNIWCFIVEMEMWTIVRY